MVDTTAPQAACVRTRDQLLAALVDAVEARVSSERGCGAPWAAATAVPERPEPAQL